MGGAQPLAAVFAGLCMLAIEVDATRIAMRLRTGYLDEQADSLDDALARIQAACKEVHQISQREREREREREKRERENGTCIVADDVISRHNKGRAISVGLCGNAADVFATLAQRETLPDIVTDQTSAHDPLNGYLPQVLE